MKKQSVQTLLFVQPLGKVPTDIQFPEAGMLEDDAFGACGNYSCERCVGMVVVEHYGLREG